MKIYFLFPFLVLFTCASPQKNFDKGNYEKSFKSALKRLKNGKKESKTKLILNKSLDKLIANSAMKIQKDIESDHEEHWIESLQTTDELLEKISEAKPFLGSKFKEKQLILDDFRTNLRSQLFNHYYDIALVIFNDAEDTGSKQQFQDAYYALTDTKQYCDEDNIDEIEQLLSQSIEMGRYYYHVEVKTPYDGFYRTDIDYIFRRLDGDIGLFTKIFFEERPTVECDCFLRIEFQGLDINEDKKYDSASYYKSVITDYREERDTAGNVTQIPVYAEIEGTVNETIYVKTLTWNVRVVVVPNSDNCSLKSHYLSREMETSYEEINFDGDERAIPDDRKHASGYSDYTKNEHQLINELLDVLYWDIQRYYFD